ncbi:hypothetical protein [Streptomyces albidus (ex Kaewkla and Franco 2022)]|uniref:hypothetical protein n=1 Tax=Streptomyces albidus (ex Kaewkla and Franco 2022) TaxID=722709 RepID=UPI0015EEE3B8|nr:hypothetical protein [Streptomyces albidus (ex Kaewkla and Franco 2022)]
MTSHDAMYGRQSGDPSGSGSTQPGGGYRIEIASVRRMLDPLEESVVAARKIKGDWKSLSELIQNSATFEIEDSAKKVLSSWGFAMGRVAEHTDAIVERLNQTIAAYILADMLGVQHFTPTEDNIAKLPIGDAGKWAWEHGARPNFDPPRKIMQEPWPETGPVA